MEEAFTDLLARPEPQGLTNEELDNLADSVWVRKEAIKEYGSICNIFDCCAFARAAIAADRARFGRPTSEENFDG